MRSGLHADFMQNIAEHCSYERSQTDRIHTVAGAAWTEVFICYIFTPPAGCRRRGGVLKCPRFCFCFFFSVESWAAAHGLYRCTVYRLLSEPMSTRLLNSISSRTCRQNTQFNMYTTTSKQQEGCTFKDFHPKCFIATNFDKFHREAFARAVNRGDVLTACFRDIQSQRSIRMAFVIIMILFDVKDYRLLYGSISLSSEKIYTRQSRFFQMFIN